MMAALVCLDVFRSILRVPLMEQRHTTDVRDMVRVEVGVARPTGSRCSTSPCRAVLATVHHDCGVDLVHGMITGAVGGHHAWDAGASQGKGGGFPSHQVGHDQHGPLPARDDARLVVRQLAVVVRGGG
jgi:hypothetical protein